MAAMMVLLWGGVVALIASEARAMIGPRGSDEAMDTLRRRLASGEITREDFETTRRAAAGVATCASAADSGPGHADAPWSVRQRQVDGGLQGRQRSLRALAYDPHPLGVQGLEPAEQAPRSRQVRRPEVPHELAASGQPQRRVHQRRLQEGQLRVGDPQPLFDQEEREGRHLICSLAGGPGERHPRKPVGPPVFRPYSTQRASWVRELIPSLLSMLVTCVSTVRLEMNSRTAISRLVSPSATSRAISSSRRLRTGAVVAEAGASFGPAWPRT